MPLSRTEKSHAFPCRSAAIWICDGTPAFIPDRVAHQILEELLQLDIMHADAGQIATGNGGAARLDGRLKIGKRLVQAPA